jgi:hypothetical protein
VFSGKTGRSDGAVFGPRRGFFCAPAAFVGAFGAVLAEHRIAMEQHSPRRLGQNRLSTLLLAGSAICVTGTVRAEPIQGYWLAPTVLASNLGIETSVAAQQVKALKKKIFAKDDVALFVAPEPNWKYLTPALDGFDEPVQFQDSDAPQAPFSFKLRSSSFDLEPAVNVKVDRLANGANFSTGNVAGESVGFDAQLFDGRLSFSTDIAKTDDIADTRDFRDPQLRDQDRSINLRDTSRRHRFSAKVIDTENLRLLVDGDFGETSEGFATSLNELPTGRLVLPGSWANLQPRNWRGARKGRLQRLRHEPRSAEAPGLHVGLCLIGSVRVPQGGDGV